VRRCSDVDVIRVVSEHLDKSLVAALVDATHSQAPVVSYDYLIFRGLSAPRKGSSRTRTRAGLPRLLEIHLARRVRDPLHVLCAICPHFVWQAGLTGTSFTATTLSPNRSYRLWLQAVDGNGGGPWTAVNFSTLSNLTAPVVITPTPNAAVAGPPTADWHEFRCHDTFAQPLLPAVAAGRGRDGGGPWAAVNFTVTGTGRGRWQRRYWSPSTGLKKLRPFASFDRSKAPV
jgi:hypothetical protein